MSLRNLLIIVVLLLIGLFWSVPSCGQSFGEGFFYVGATLNLYNPRESFYIGDHHSYDPIEVAIGMGPGLNLGLNLTSHLSFPDISMGMTSYLYKEPGDVWYYGDSIASYELRIYNIMLGGKYKFGHWRVEPYVRAGLLFQDIRLQEKILFGVPYLDDLYSTNFYWGFAPYMGGGASYYITPRIYMSLDALYSFGTGSTKSPYEDYHTIRTGGNHINFAFGVLPF